MGKPNGVQTSQVGKRSDRKTPTPSAQRGPDFTASPPMIAVTNDKQVNHIPNTNSNSNG